MSTTTDTAPLRRNWFHILLAFSRGAEHGYAVMKDVEEQTGGHLRLWPATLYGALADLVEEGLIVEIEGDERDERRDRRLYRLTGEGRTRLRAEAERLAGLVAMAREQRGEEA